MLKMHIAEYLGIKILKNASTDKVSTLKDDIRIRCEGPIEITKQKKEHHILVKMSRQSYQGQRHYYKLPVRGQRTKSNAATRKGRHLNMSQKTAYRKKRSVQQKNQIFHKKIRFQSESIRIYTKSIL